MKLGNYEKEITEAEPVKIVDGELNHNWASPDEGRSNSRNGGIETKTKRIFEINR